MSWLHGLENIVEEHVPLARRTWYQLGGSARYLATPETLDQLRTIVCRATDAGLCLKVLGGGANVLVRDEGFAGVVVQLDKEAFGEVRFQGEDVIVGSAADLPDLVRRCVRQRLAGMEVLAGIPGTVGGAVRMNAGGKYGDIAPSVHAVTIMTRLGEVRRLSAEQLSFGYRRSNVVEHIVVGVELRLRSEPAGTLEQRYRDIWEFKRSTQPFARNNAGCMFRNPAGIAAGKLIDEAGLKGIECGGASVSTRHANFIVTGPGTATRDILALVRTIQDRVQNQFNIRLELEVDVW